MLFVSNTVWINPVSEYMKSDTSQESDVEQSDIDKQPKADEGLKEEEDDALMMDIHRNFVPLKVVNAGHYRNCPLPYLAPVSPRQRKINTAPGARSIWKTVVRSSNSSPLSNAFANSSELASYSHDRDNSNNSRQTSSSSSTSVPLERKNNSKSPHYTSSRHSRHKNGALHDKRLSSDTLPVVSTDESVNTSVHMLPLNVRQSRSHMALQSAAASSNPHSQKNPLNISSKTQHVNSLSISGIKQDGSSSGSRCDDAPEEDDVRLSQLQISDNKLPSKPPSLHLYTNLPSQLQSGATSQQPASMVLPKKRQPKIQLSSGRSRGHQKSQAEPKYADPIIGSTTSFQSRLAELASLEAETVRWERMRKIKKKTRDD